MFLYIYVYIYIHAPLPALWTNRWTSRNGCRWLSTCWTSWRVGCQLLLFSRWSFWKETSPGRNQAPWRKGWIGESLAFQARVASAASAASAASDAASAGPRSWRGWAAASAAWAAASAPASGSTAWSYLSIFWTELIFCFFCSSIHCEGWREGGWGGGIGYWSPQILEISSGADTCGGFTVRTSYKL